MKLSQHLAVRYKGFFKSVIDACSRLIPPMSRFTMHHQYRRQNEQWDDTEGRLDEIVKKSPGVGSEEADILRGVKK